MQERRNVAGATIVSIAIVMGACAGEQNARNTVTPERAVLKKDIEECRGSLGEARERIAELERAYARLEATYEGQKKEIALAEERAMTYRATAEELRAAFAPADVPAELEDGLMVVQISNDVLFDFGEATLRPEGREALAEAAVILRRESRDTGNPGRKFLIVGHTDDVPVIPNTRAYSSNWELSTLRALAVVNFLTASGVDPDHIAAAGFGEHMPVADNDTAEGRQKNRRTEIVLFPTVDELPPVPGERPDRLAAAQPEEEEEEAPEAPTEMPEMEREEAEPTMLDAGREPMGFSITAGGGLTQFINPTVQDFTDPGGLWGVRAAYGTRSRVALEAAYLGSAQNIEALGLDEDAVLLSTGLDATARLNLLTGAWQPYVTVGAAWKRYDLVRADINTSSVRDDDNVFEVPLSLGVSYRFRNLVIDGRAAFRPAVGSGLLDEETDDLRTTSSLHNYGLLATFGVEI